MLRNGPLRDWNARKIHHDWVTGSRLTEDNFSALLASTLGTRRFILIEFPSRTIYRWLCDCILPLGGPFQNAEWKRRRLRNGWFLESLFFEVLERSGKVLLEK